MWSFRKVRSRNLRRNFRLREAEKRGEEIQKLTTLKRRRFLAAFPFHRWWKTTSKILIIILIAAFAVALVFFVFFSSSVHIQKIIYAKNGEESTVSVFASKVNPFIGKNMFLVPTTAREIEILQTFPDEIARINFKRKFPSTLLVEYEPFPNVANIIIRQEALQKKFLINEKGLIVAEDAEDPELPYITFELQEMPKLKTILIPQPYLQAMVKAEKLFTDKFGMKVTEVQYKKREREVHLVTARDFLVLLDLTQDVEAQLFKLKRALSKINIFEGNLAYIDLRISGQIGDKVVIKRR